MAARLLHEQLALVDTTIGPQDLPADPASELWEFAYYSSACFALQEADLRYLVRGARERNRSLGVTGMLVYWNQSFFQVLEGPRSTVEGVFETFIRPSSSHSGIIKAHEGRLATRTFPSWALAAQVASTDEIMDIEKAIERSRTATELQESGSVGAVLLQAFLAAAGRQIT